MVRLSQLTVLAALFSSTILVAAQQVANGPNKLDDCQCGPIYKAITKCETIKRPGGIGDEIKQCICIPNSEPDAWYGWLSKCTTCLGNGAPPDSFYANLATMITQLFTSCTNPGGNVFSDGQSVCATNAMWSLCTSLKDGSKGTPSWASFERSQSQGDNSNATQILNIKDFFETTTTSSSSSSSADGAASKTSTPSSGTASTSTTATQSKTATSSPPSLAGSGCRSNSLLAGFAIAAGVGAVLA